MNTLTKNRIIQEGDEYRDNGKWKPVPANDFGLQIMFSKYAEVRRPSETPSPTSTISPDEGHATPAKAEKVNAPAPIPSGAGETPSTVKLAQSEQEIEANGLPTVVSTKAHKAHLKTLYGKRETPDTAKDAPTELAKSPASPTPPLFEIDYPPKSDCIWIGRNGTFNQRGIHMIRAGEVITFRPKGKRGLAKNAKIDIPVSEAAKLASWLLGQVIPK